MTRAITWVWHRRRRLARAHTIGDGFGTGLCCAL